MKKNAWFFIILLALSFVSGGCSKGSGTANSKAFDNAKPEIKALWGKVLTAAGSNDYVPTVLMCRTLAAREDITADQKTTVENKLSDVYEKMNTSAGNGDKQAQAAVDELRKIGRPRN